MATPLDSQAAYLAAASLLVDAYAALEVACRPLPEGGSYVVAGDFAWDCCDALAVQVLRVAPVHGSASPGRRPRESCGVVWGAEATLHLLRCFPTLDEDGQPPPPDSIDEASAGLLMDAGVLLAAVSCGALGACTSRGSGGYRIEGPRGACASVSLPVTIPLGQS